MPGQSKTSVKEFFTGVALLAGFGLAYVLLWVVALLVLAAMIFFALTVFTDWNLGARIGSSLVSAFITMKVLGLIFATFDLIPESWLNARKETKPCPECGKNLRTARAQQCMHCGADWHS